MKCDGGVDLVVVSCVRSPAGVRPDPGDRGGDDGDGGRHHLSAEPLPPISSLAPLQTRPHTQETPAAGQRESNAVRWVHTVVTYRNMITAFLFYMEIITTSNILFPVTMCMMFIVLHRLFYIRYEKIQRFVSIFFITETLFSSSAPLT